MKSLLHLLFSNRLPRAKSIRPTLRRRPAVRGYLEELEDRWVLSPTLATINTVVLPVGKTFQVPLDGGDTVAGAMLSYSITSNNSNVTATLSPSTNPVIEIDVDLNNDTVSDGTLKLQLFSDLAPLTTARILALIDSGFYDGLTFHRVIQNFVIQGGDPAGNGTGGSGIDFADEFKSPDPQQTYIVTFTGFGQLAMANSGDDTNDSQFFITDVDLGIGGIAPPQSLNGNHTIFGQLIEGAAIVAQIIASDGADGDEAPDTTVRMLDVRRSTDEQNGVLRLTPVGAAGTSSMITVTATSSAGGTPASQTFTVNIVADTQDGTTNGAAVDDRAFLNVPPSAFPNIPSNLTTNEDIVVQIPVTELETTGNLTVHIVNTLPATATGTITTNNVANLSVSINPITREITLTPGADFHGTLDFFLAMRDDTRRTDTNGDGQVTTTDNIDALGNYDTQHIVLTVNVVNDVPTAANASGVFRNDGSTTTITLVAADGDPGSDAPDTQTLTFEVVDPPDHGTVTISAAGVATYTPDGDFEGRDSFIYRVMDNGGTANGGIDTSLPATVTLDFDASSAMLRGGVLTIVGGEIGDDIDLAFVANAAGDADDEIDVTLNGNDGGAFLLSDIARISIQSLGGDDVITIDVEIDKPSQIETGDGNDDVSSGDGDDVINTGTGDDIVDAGDGENVILGGKGADDLTGGEDADLIRGGKGDDTNLDGADGDDNIRGGKGDDLIEGGDGDDRLFGNEGDDDMSGSEGDDMMKGGYGSDNLDGGDGDDKMIGGPEFQAGGRIDGIDTMDGGEGADTLRGGAGNDDLNGGEDDDRDVLRGGDGDDIIERVFGWADQGRAGTATFLLPGAPRTHPDFPGPDGIVGNADDPDVLLEAPHTDTQTTAVDYTGYSNPPTYGPHHPSPLEPSGVYTTEQDDATMVHNLEHGEIWISFDPAQLTIDEVNRLAELVRSFGDDSGIFLTPRPANDDARPIALVSWGRLQTLVRFDGEAIRRFIDKNQGTGNE